MKKTEKSSPLQVFKQALKNDWYIQGVSAAPAFLSVSMFSCSTMGRVLGFRYSVSLIKYKERYGEGFYLVDDLERLWRTVKQKLAQNPNYLKETKKLYQSIFDKGEKALKKEMVNLKQLSDEKLVSLLKEAAKLQTDSVGIAHIIEAIGVGLEKDFKTELISEIKNKEKFNEYYVLLAAPTEPSFIAKEENDLRGIARLKGVERKQALKKHFEKYFWLQNSYAGPKKLTLDFFADRLELAESSKTGQGVENGQDVRDEKNSLIEKLNLSQASQQMTELIDFTTVWQDERKVNILKAVSYLGMVLEEIKKRTELELGLLYCLSVSDIEKPSSLEELIDLKQELETRQKGCFVLIRGDKEFIASGSLYKNLVKEQDDITEGEKENKLELHGSIANRGTAIGKVVILKNISSMHLVKQGDVIVSSMTRPEYMPAIRKAVAIVTDEGGITCHAAIVSRELNIPAVIGTKIATKVLRDGMRVEVRANHGAVKIIS